MSDHESKGSSGASDVGFEQIWNEYRSGLRAFLHSRVSNPSDVDDLLQDILIKTHSNLNTLRNRDSLRSWVMQIAHRSIVDYHRKNRRIAATEPLEPDDVGSEPDEAEMERALAPCVEPFIAALPREDAQLLRKIELDGCSQKACAEELGISYSTLKSRVQRARSRLRRIVKNCCHLSIDGRGKVIDYESRAAACGICRGGAKSEC